MRHYFTTSITCLCIILSGCSKSNNSDNTTDYSNSNNWISVPTTIKHQVDLFYLYPSCWTRNNDSEAVVADINNPMMRTNATELVRWEAACYEPYTNVFAPFYRQYDPNYLLTMPVEKHFELFANEDRTDALAAFDYYIRHYNNGRPFILGGHSQGSATLLYVLSDYMKEHPEVYQRMIAAYIIGFSVWKDYLQAYPHLKFAQRADDTGVIVSFHTEAPEYASAHPLLMDGTIGINPLNWKRDNTYAGSELNLGTYIKDLDGQFKDSTGFADAQLKLSRGTVICSTADTLRFNTYPIFPYGCFHNQDYHFYYYNIRENAKTRIDAYFSRLLP